MVVRFGIRRRCASGRCPCAPALRAGSTCASVGLTDYSQVDILELWYKFVHFGVEKSPGGWYVSGRSADAHRGVAHAPHAEHHLGFEVWGLGFGVWGLGFGGWGLGFGVWGLGSGVWGLGWTSSLPCRTGTSKNAVGNCGERESETTGYQPFALHAPIQWAI